MLATACWYCSCTAGVVGEGSARCKLCCRCQTSASASFTALHLLSQKVVGLSLVVAPKFETELQALTVVGAMCTFATTKREFCSGSLTICAEIKNATTPKNNNNKTKQTNQPANQPTKQTAKQQQKREASLRHPNQLSSDK